jgi:teichuronic acid biosynthesis glycosyltransferase TuaC
MPISITRSADLARRLKEAGAAADKLKPIYNGVDTALFHPGSSPNPVLDKNSRWLLFVGNFLPVKNPQLLLKAWAIVRKNLPQEDVRLAMIGSGPLEGEIRSAAAGAGLSEFLEIAGRQAPNKVAEYMRAADVLCMSSHNEGVPNVVLEAFSSGLPVISTNVGGISEVLDHSFLGELVPPNDAQALATAITQYLNSPINSSEIAKHAQRYSWQQTAHDYFDNIVN